MYHFQVKIINRFSIVTVRTTLGSYKPCNHPMQDTIRILPVPREGIQIDDLVRCDGLPYLTRPRAKSIKQHWHNIANPTEIIEIKKYIPIKISSDMWVLREDSIKSLDLKERGK